MRLPSTSQGHIAILFHAVIRIDGRDIALAWWHLPPLHTEQPLLYLIAGMS
ncbi:hypothetical protein ACI2I2_23860 [Scandinavium sp. NPDC088450]|uniref:hypothetical protein n=1 Tax=Scandinavium sp. NPDC088450 TaxID=3364514 RepID=UPI00384F2ECD